MTVMNVNNFRFEKYLDVYDSKTMVAEMCQYVVVKWSNENVFDCCMTY